MERFVYEAAPARVVFGAGSLSETGAEIDRLGCSRALVLSTPGRHALAARGAEDIGARAAGVYAKAVMHVPVEVAEAACEAADALGADCLIAIGGGSAVGLGKAIALRSGRPVIAVPTTFAGSEMTAVWGQTENGLKRTGRDPKVLPRTVIYDSVLLASLPMSIAAPSAMNALAHCVEALYAVDTNPVVSLMAEEGIRAIVRSLPDLASGKPLLRPGALERAQYGCWMASMALNGASVALHHKLCHTLGGTLNLPHAQTHSIVLPHATAYNANAAPEAMDRIAAALGEYGEEGAAIGLQRFARAIGAPTALRELQAPRERMREIAQIAVANPYPNPRELELEAIVELLKRACLADAPPAVA